MRIAIVLLAAGLTFAGCKRTEPEPPAGAALPQMQLTDPRYKDLVFLVATVRKSGPDFLITNDSTQPWFDVTIVLVADGDEYRYRTNEVDPGQSMTAPAAAFSTTRDVPFDPARVMPRTLIVSAEIGEGGPTGVYAVRL